MTEDQRQPFVFGVVFTVGEKVSLETLLHQQFPSDEALSLWLLAWGYELLKDSRIVIDDSTGVAVDEIGIGIIDQPGSVGMVEIIDKSQIPRVKKYIDEAKGQKRRPFFSSINFPEEIV